MEEQKEKSGTENQEPNQDQKVEELYPLQQQWAQDNALQKEEKARYFLDDNDEKLPPIALFPIKCYPLNGSGKVVVQATDLGPMMTESGLYVAKNLQIDVQPKFKKQFGDFNNVVFHVVEYDPDINLRYRHDKLQWMRMKDIEQLGNSQGDIRLKNKIKEMEENGELDIVRRGDQCFFNTDHFQLVELTFLRRVYYVAHHMDILMIKKGFPRLQMERPDLYPEAFRPPQSLEEE